MCYFFRRVDCEEICCQAKHDKRLGVRLPSMLNIESRVGCWIFWGVKWMIYLLLKKWKEKLWYIMHHKTVDSMNLQCLFKGAENSRLTVKFKVKWCFHLLMMILCLARGLRQMMLCLLREMMPSFVCYELFDPTFYRSIAGALQYLTWTRLDLAFAVNQVCQYMHFLRTIHLQAIKQILRYLTGIIDSWLWFTKGSQCLTALFDAD